MRGAATFLLFLALGAAPAVRAQDAVTREQERELKQQQRILKQQEKQQKQEERQLKQDDRESMVEELLAMTPQQRRQWLADLPQGQRQRFLDRLNAIEKNLQQLSPEERQLLKGRLRGFANLAADRQRAVRNAIQRLRSLPPGQRARQLRMLRDQFSPQEMNLLRGVVQAE